MPAAWEVLPLASSVEKQRVSFLFGRSLMNRENIYILNKTSVFGAKFQRGIVGDDIFAGRHRKYVNIHRVLEHSEA